MSRFKREMAFLFLCLILAGAFVLLATPGALATEHLQMDSFNATSIVVVNGTLNDGNLASTYLLDGDWYNISETNGVPGLDIRVNFTGLGTDQTGGCFGFYHLYSGHSNHEIQVQLWNFTDSSWELVGTVLFNETAGWKCVGLSPQYEHYFSGGKLWARFYHATVGHLAHELQIDEIELHVSYTFECPPPAITDSCAVVDDYTDETGVAGKHQVVRNTTYDAMELAVKTGGGVLENYTAYSELDPNGHITRNNDTHITFVTLGENEDARVYYDYGVGYFTDFFHENDVIGDDNDPDANTENIAVWGVSKDLDDYANIDDALGMRLISNGNAPEIWFFRLNVRESDVSTESDDSVNVNEDQWYYLTYNRTGDNLTSKIYSDQARTVLVDTLTVTLTNSSETYRYVHAINTFNKAQADWISGRVANLDIGSTTSGYADSGYFYTADLLTGIDYVGQAVLLNTTIPGGDTLTVEFSEDNSTWILNDWEPIFGGYEAVDIRVLAYNTLYLRFNFTDGGADSTPRLYQTKIYHGAPCPDGVAEADYTPYMALAIILLLFGLMIGQRLKR